MAVSILLLYKIAPAMLAPFGSRIAPTTHAALQREDEAEEEVAESLEEEEGREHVDAVLREYKTLDRGSVHRCHSCLCPGAATLVDVLGIMLRRRPCALVL